MLVIDFGEAFEVFRFPAGEPHVRCTRSPGTMQGATVVCRAADWNDLLNIRAAADICQHARFFVPYLPFGRADKPRDGIEANVAQLAVDVLGGGYGNIVTLDPHSAVSAELPHYTCADFVRYALQGPPNIKADLAAGVTVVVPDAGARAKAATYLHWFGVAKVVLASKRRDPDTGALSGFELDGGVGRGPVVIVDDIIDGGGTFVGLADLIRQSPGFVGETRMILIATHGLFTRGADLLLSRFDRIVTMPRPPQQPPAPVRLYPPGVFPVDPADFLRFTRSCDQ